VVGTLGGLIGLGGAEFRLPLLIGVFRFAALEAVILNKTMSLVVVASALPFRAQTVPWTAIAGHWTVIANLLAGSLLGAWLGADWATRLRTHTLYQVIAVLLVAIAAVLALGHDATAGGPPLFGGVLQSELCGPKSQPFVYIGDGSRFGRRDVHRRPAARHRAEPGSNTAARHHPDDLGDENLAAQVAGLPIRDASPRQHRLSRSRRIKDEREAA
jgi:hypothetical protein